MAYSDYLYGLFSVVQPYAKFPTSGQVSHSKGCIELWVKPNWDNTSTTEACFWDTDAGTSSEQLKLVYKDIGAGTYRLCVERDGIRYIDWQPDWIVNTQVHLAVTYDSAGTDSLMGGDTIKLYKDGVEVGTASTTTWTAGTLGTYLYLGVDNSESNKASAILDNLRVYDYCKVHFRADDYVENIPLITAPNGGENLSTRYYNITFDKNLATDEYYRIEYSTDGGSTWNLIADGVLTSPYNWDLGAVPDSVNCYIRIKGKNTTTTWDLSDAAFEISGGVC